jgi:hypothetical protein
MFKSLNIESLSFGRINNYKLLIYKNKFLYYKIIPSKLSVLKDSLNAIKILNFSYSNVNGFVSFFNSINNLNRIFKVILILKGLGLKAVYLLNRRVLKFKLGFSHRPRLFVSKEVFIRVKKKIIFLRSANKEKLGSFAFRLKSLRLPDSYRGKGIWYKSENKKLKIFKKKR